MKLSSLRDLFIHELQDLYSAENQLLKVMPTIMEATSNKKLKDSLQKHMKETEEQVSRLEECAKILDVKITGEKCKAMEGLVKEAKTFLEEEATPEVLDAGIIACCQRVEHYEIAGYGTACTYAKSLGEDEVLALLKETLNEEKTTDELLTKIAETTVNKKADV